jgi:hypothetical protein
VCIDLSDECENVAYRKWQLWNRNK